MGFFARLKALFSPARLTTSARVVADKPLHEQFQRIGGGVDPVAVTNFLRLADAGQPERLIDLANESRQRDGHMQAACGARELAVALTDLDFIEPENATAKEKDAVDLCRRIRDDFLNWQTLLEHLGGAFLPGHATAETRWEKKPDGALLPVEAFPLHARDFIFSRAEGALRYRRSIGDTVGIDLREENPGRIIQVQRRIVGDVPAREGLMRVLVWAALFRNWTLRDWIALGEIGWKPWRIGKFEAGANQEDIDKLIRALERIGADGIGAVPDNTGLSVEWPRGSGHASVHRELFDAVGREMSKATIGTTTTLEAGPNGDRAGVQARDRVRGDIREADCRAIAGGLRRDLFLPAVIVNLGADVRCPAPWFQTEEATDRKAFSEAIKTLTEAGLPIPAKWVRDEIGMPEPVEGEELLGKTQVQVPPPPPPDDDDEELDIPIEVEEPEDEDKRIKAAGAEPERNGREYTDRLEQSAIETGARELALTVASMVAAVQTAGSYQEARSAILERYRGMDPPRNLAELTEAALVLGQAAGKLAVMEETPELER